MYHMHHNILYVVDLFICV